MSDILASRTDWTRDEIARIFALPFTELVFRGAKTHCLHHQADEVQLCTLLSIKTGGCPEDCGYCSQSVKVDSGVAATKLMEVQQVSTILQDVSNTQCRPSLLIESPFPTPSP